MDNSFIRADEDYERYVRGEFGAAERQAIRREIQDARGREREDIRSLIGDPYHHAQFQDLQENTEGNENDRGKDLVGESSTIQQ